MFYGKHFLHPQFNGLKGGPVPVGSIRIRAPNLVPVNRAISISPASSDQELPDPEARPSMLEAPVPNQKGKGPTVHVVASATNSNVPEIKMDMEFALVQKKLDVLKSYEMRDIELHNARMTVLAAEEERHVKFYEHAHAVLDSNHGMPINTVVEGIIDSQIIDTVVMPFSPRIPRL